MDCDFPLNAFCCITPRFLPQWMAVPICFCSQSLVNVPLFCVLNWHRCGIISQETVNRIICLREGGGNLSSRYTIQQWIESLSILLIFLRGRYMRKSGFFLNNGMRTLALNLYVYVGMFDCFLCERKAGMDISIRLLSILM